MYGDYYGYTSSNMLLNLLGTYLVVILVLWALLVVANWKIFTKAGKPGWASLVPFYKTYVEFDAFWGETKYFWFWLVSCFCAAIPVLGWILMVANVVIGIMLNHKKSQAFGHDVGFTLGLFFLPNVFSLILGFNKDKYLGIPKKSDAEKVVDAKLDDLVKDNLTTKEEVKEDSYVDGVKEGNENGPTNVVEPNEVHENPQDVVTEKEEKIVDAEFTEKSSNNGFFDDAVKHPENDGELNESTRNNVQMLRELEKQKGDNEGQ